MKTLVFALIMIVGNNLSAQSLKAAWDSVKNTTKPLVSASFQAEYETPTKQPLADYGWEDGVHISPDGLHLYALYSPMDLLSRTIFVLNNTGPICNWIGNMSYRRSYASSYGMDLHSNPFGCDSFPNIDILYAQRNTTDLPFSKWQLSGIARPFLSEGSPAPLFSATDPSKLDLFMFTGDGDIWMLDQTMANPSGIQNATRLPAPINPINKEFNADNPTLVRIKPDTLLMLYEQYTQPSKRTFMYTLSGNMASTWSVPKPLKISSLENIEHPFLYKDENKQWWLYFTINYERIVRARQTQSGNWESWDTPEIIISKGNALSIGEPTLTTRGDLSFVLGYRNTTTQDTTDVYDLDPWIMSRKAVLTGLEKDTFVDKKELYRIITPLGREVKPEQAIDGLFIYQYTDGSTAKIVR